VPRGFETYHGVFDGVSLDHANVDPNPVSVGFRLETAVPGRVIGVKFFRDLNDGNEHVGMLITDDLSEIIDVVKFHKIAASGSGPDQWHSAYFRKMHHFSGSGRFVVACFFGGGNYWSDTGLVASAPFVNGNLTITQDGDGGDNGLFTYGNLVPTSTFGSSIYGVDVIFLEDH